MIEIEIYAAGLRAPEKLMGLDLELGANPGIRYKVDTLHDIVFMESDDPDISQEEIMAVFKKLDLEPCFVGQTHTAVPTLSKTQLIQP